MLGLGVGTLLPTFDATGHGLPDTRDVARQAEDLGFDHLWVGDHLSFHGSPWLEATIALTIVGEATSRSAIGFSVLLPSLRQVAWAAKQIQTLQYRYPDRFQLGIGVGGEEPREWVAAGVPLTERGARTDAFLSALPELLEGHETSIQGPGGTVVPQLQPAVNVPPIWIGGRVDAALRRAARFGDVWLGAFIDDKHVRRGRERLDELAVEAGRQQRPSMAISAFVSLSHSRAFAEQQAKEYVEGIYGVPFEKMERYVIMGDEQEVTSQLSTLIEAGIEGIAFVPAGREPRKMLPSLARVRSMLLDAHGHDHAGV